MLKLSIIGTGNVAFHLARAFSAAQGVNLQFVAGRDLEKLKTFEEFSATLNLNKELEKTFYSDVILIAVSDASIAAVSQQLMESKALIVHTSGSTAIQILDQNKRCGVLYPLQSFSKEKELVYKEIPFLIEAKLQDDLGVLKLLTESLSANYFTVNSKDRAALHLAAVFSNNFTNHILTEAKQLCNDHNVSFELLKPLMLETVQKAFSIGPENSQTGPAKRKDTPTINKQLSALKSAEQKQLYTLLTQAIQNYYER
ncbi:Rossmann-like and DUF2520 domain-containing protein [Leeuwenhoekiella polynyae]|uniref:Putative short-subunit dehydrogenase-like oxidoreductase (DUF2520 family) n=1 Tax=Leeuwenhoekiella polynyae TaxID=1550906 RepID=A0A4Q0NP24_9FLAO|nr:Rossmann-like and DUF2520 domain-containing protein [Leeuwenhoekiella polynyae]RXG11900.1 putative short-subunit dehydrogenase-like oxidoreductase (DUF2520 family) [Leeuwenhoekiella polynyae]